MAAAAVPVVILAGMLFSSPQWVEAVTIPARAATVSTPVKGEKVVNLPFPAQNVALHWRGEPGAAVTFATSTDGATFGTPFDAGRDEVGEQRGNGETYGAVSSAPGAVAVRVTSDRPLSRLSVLVLADGERRVERRPASTAAGAGVAQPAVKARAEWGADESLRFDSAGKEKWPPTFHPVQKLLVHHTAGANDDLDPAATIRGIYFYHTVTQGWGDIGYNFLVDESGRIYEGRHSRPYAAGEAPTGEDLSGNGVAGAHASGYNSGTVGVALLGTLTDQDAKPAAKSALQDLLAWKADRHGIDPEGNSLYTNPVNGTQKTFANIAGHRDVSATECPGGVFYATLPDVRAAVAQRIAAANTATTTTTTTTVAPTTTTTVAPTTTTTTTTVAPTDTAAPTAPTGLAATGGKRKVTLSWSASTDTGGSGLAGYEVFRSTAGGTATRVASTTALTYTDTGVISGTTYTYVVKAYDGSGNRSTASNSATAKAR